MSQERQAFRRVERNLEGNRHFCNVAFRHTSRKIPSENENSHNVVNLIPNGISAYKNVVERICTATPGSSRYCNADVASPSVPSSSQPPATLNLRFSVSLALPRFRPSLSHLQFLRTVTFTLEAVRVPHYDL